MIERFNVITIKSDGRYSYNAVMKIISLKYVKFQNVLSFRHCMIKSFDRFEDKCSKTWPLVATSIFFEDNVKARIYRKDMSDDVCGNEHWMQDYYTTIPVIACTFPRQEVMICRLKNNHTFIWIKEKS